MNILAPLALLLLLAVVANSAVVHRQAKVEQSADKVEVKATQKKAKTEENTEMAKEKDESEPKPDEPEKEEPEKISGEAEDEEAESNEAEDEEAEDNETEDEKAEANEAEEPEAAGSELKEIEANSNSSDAKSKPAKLEQPLRLRKRRQPPPKLRQLPVTDVPLEEAEEKYTPGFNRDELKEGEVVFENGKCNKWINVFSMNDPPKTDVDLRDGVDNKGSICGSESFSEWSTCSKIAFYGLDGYKNAKEKFGVDKEEHDGNFKDMKEFDKYGFMHDMVLLLIDGCIFCKKSAIEKVTLQLNQLMPEGKNEKVCPEYRKEHKILNETMKMNTTTASSRADFSYRALLLERLCPVKVGEDKNGTKQYAIQQLKYVYDEVVLTVTHNCGGTEKSVNIFLPSIDVYDKKMVKGNVMQIRRLSLNLDNLKDDVRMNVTIAPNDISGPNVFGEILGSNPPGKVTESPKETMEPPGKKKK